MTESGISISGTKLQSAEVKIESLSMQEDGRLMRAFLAGDDRAFAELFDRHHQRLYLYCARLTGDPPGAEDVMQEVWERLIRLRSEPQDIRNPVGFLLTIARNLSLNFLKKVERRRKFRQEMERQGSEADDKEEELTEAVLEGLDRLPMKYREVLLLNIYSGYGFEEIGTMLGISTEAAWKRASRGRKELRRIILDHPSGGRNNQATGKR